MSTRSGRIRTSVIELSPPRTRKGVSPTRSPARTRKSSPPPTVKTPPPTRSSGRKSPARKSPSRKSASKFPARKSPSRTTKEITQPEVPNFLKSPGKRPPIDSEPAVAIKLEDWSTKLAVYRGTRSKRLEYSIKDLSSSITEHEYSLDKVNGVEPKDIYGVRNRRSVEEVATRRSSRLREYIDNVPDIRRSLSKSISKSISKSVSKSIETYSDEGNSEEEFQREKLVTRKLATPLRTSINNLTQIPNKWEFGGRIGSLCLMLLIPITVFSVLLSCTKSCSPKSLLDLSAYKSLQVYFSFQALNFILVQYVLQVIFAVVPIFGTRSDRMDETGTRHCFNAFFSSIVTINTLFLLDFFKVINKETLLNEFLRLAVISYIFAIILSIILYIKSGKIIKNDLNQYGNTGYALYDFFMGRETHPFIKKLDVKIWISRISNINSLIFLSLIFTHGLQIKLTEKNDFTLENLKQLLSNVQLKPTIIVFSMMQLVYILNFIMREYRITATFYWQSEGVGYLQTVSSALYPFYFTTISKHVADTDLVLPTNTLISASVLFVLGFFIMLVSNNIKYEFRRNPLHLSLGNVESMPTFHGKKLLISGAWGILRHPNYTGDILIHTALALPGILSGQYLAATPAISTIVVLMHRAWRDNDRCKRRYGAAWQRYCKRVPSVLLPKIL